LSRAGAARQLATAGDTNTSQCLAGDGQKRSVNNWLQHSKHLNLAQLTIIDLPAQNTVCGPICNSPYYMTRHKRKNSIVYQGIAQVFVSGQVARPLSPQDVVTGATFGRTI
jgi:hypothetical protein